MNSILDPVALPANDDIRWLGHAYDFAKNSPDPSTQNGAVIVSPDGRFISGAANNIPCRLREAFPRSTLADAPREQKLLLIEHAERRAILRAARDGTSTEGATMYCPFAACPDCAKAIVESGIVRLVCDANALRDTPERWFEPVSNGLYLILSAGIVVDLIDSPLGVEILFDGKLVQR